jgi:predicted nucleotidyltransferase component of viral defense system
MTLHQDKPLFRESIEAAAQHLTLRPTFVEKDYWVTYALRNLSLSAYSEIIVFKGGTSLSKAYQCIDRFSYPK